MAMNEHEEILTVAEVAARLRCSKTHVCKAINGQVKGLPRLPAIVMGRRKLVRRITFDRWICAVEEGRDMLPPSPDLSAGRMEGEFHA